MISFDSGDFSNTKQLSFWQRSIKCRE